MFSKENIADVINGNFEPVWKMVRPVPIIQIDFGNGNKLTRTLHGNIATYICLADGTVVDILPGVYDPDSYHQQLLALKHVADRVWRAAPRPASSLAIYHRQQEARLLAEEEASSRAALKADLLRDVTKNRIERPTELTLSSRPIPVKRQPAPAPLDVTKFRVERPTELVIEPTPEKRPDVAPVPSPLKMARGELEKWEALVVDTRRNELIRRKLIHRFLKDKPGVQPAAMTKWLYREVLNTDLDDPYLGLSHTLFGSYPFSKEDAMEKR